MKLFGLVYGLPVQQISCVAENHSEAVTKFILPNDDFHILEINISSYCLVRLKNIYEQELILSDKELFLKLIADYIKF